jgi:hypothetical protein
LHIQAKLVFPSTEELACLNTGFFAEGSIWFLHPDQDAVNAASTVVKPALQLTLEAPSNLFMSCMAFWKLHIKIRICIDCIHN